MKPSYRIAFYISGHGFGHASRSVEVVQTLRERVPELSIELRTAVRREPLDRALGNTIIDLNMVECDTGMVQLDSLQIDEAESIRRAVAFHTQLSDKSAAEAKYLRTSGVALVIGDIPPLAFTAAAAAGVPSVAIANFSWDWIYSAYAHAAESGLVEILRKAYRTATIALRLPLHGGLGGLEPVMEDIPFIARSSKREPNDVRRLLGLPLDKTIVLTAFGVYGLAGVDTRALAASTDYTFVTIDFPGSPQTIDPASGIVRIADEQLYGQGLRYEDLVRAVDVIATKPGYGIISEALANDTALLYTSRGRFPEYDVLVNEMPKYLRAQFIGPDDLLAGRWAAPLEQLLSMPKPNTRPALNGAAVVADRVLQMLQS